MSILTNKHFVIALLVAPILAVITWIAVDKMVRPEPISAQAGQSFPLLAKPNCRYESGKCTLQNGDFRLELSVNESTSDFQGDWLGLESDLPIDAVRFAFLHASGETLIENDFTELDINGIRGIVLPTDVSGFETLQLAVNSNGVLYFVETQAKFLQAES